eukprot:7603731-Pyramimonas_sp.AAC.1
MAPSCAAEHRCEHCLQRQKPTWTTAPRCICEATRDIQRDASRRRLLGGDWPPARQRSCLARAARLGIARCEPSTRRQPTS